MTARVVPDDDEGRAAAVEILRAGGIVGFPTDTVYGIAAALETAGGIERLYEAKGRPSGKGIVLLLADADQARSVAVMTLAADALAKQWWPGGLTLVVPQRPDAALPAALTGGADTIGLRVPDHPTPRALATALGPLPTTSANVSGEPDALDAEGVLGRLGGVIDLVLDGGPARGGTPSTVVDCSSDPPRVLRAGATTAGEVAATLDAAGVAHAIPSDAPS